MSSQLISSAYGKLMKLFPSLMSLRAGDHIKLHADGYTPLSMDVLSNERELSHIAIAHNSVMNGDVMANPDMEVRLIHEKGVALAMTYQNDFLGMFTQARIERGGKISSFPDEAIQLDVFLNDWSSNLIKQGFVANES